MPDNVRRLGTPPEQHRGLAGETLMPICDCDVTCSSASETRGLHFQAPTDFCIRGLNVPNEMSQELQNVEVFVVDTEPAVWSSFSSSGGSVFYASSEPADQTIATLIDVEAGKFVGILGTTGTVDMRNSCCSVGNFNSNINGLPTTLKRFATQNDIATAQAPSHHAEVGYSISRVEVHCTAGTCDTDPRQGGAMGDPHFLTWSNEWFDFMGAVSLATL